MWSYAEQSEQSKLKMFSDSDDGGCLSIRKSTSGGALLRGSHFVEVLLFHPAGDQREFR